MTHPTASRLRITGMYRRATRTRAIYRITDRLHEGRTVHVPAHEIATTVSAWLAELGAHSPLVDARYMPVTGPRPLASATT